MKNTGNEDEAAIQSNESSEAVKETPQKELVRLRPIRFVDVLKLHYPARQIYAYPLVPFQF